MPEYDDGSFAPPEKPRPPPNRHGSVKNSLSDEDALLDALEKRAMDRLRDAVFKCVIRVISSAALAVLYAMGAAFGVWLGVHKWSDLGDWLWRLKN